MCLAQGHYAVTPVRLEHSSQALYHCAPVCLTNPRHHEEEPHNNHRTPGRQTNKVKQPTLSSSDINMIAKLERAQTMHYKTEQRHKPYSGSNNQQRMKTTESSPRTDSSLSHWGGGGLNVFTYYIMHIERIAGLLIPRYFA